MMDTRSNAFKTAETMQELERAIPPEHRGLTVQTGEIIVVKGWRCRVVDAHGDRLTLEVTTDREPAPRRRRNRARRR